MTSDLELLQSYLRNKSEESFTALVHRHLNLVYSAALRQVRSPQLAEEIVQSTFTDLARQAHQLKPDTILTAWLYQVTRRTAINVVRREARRQLREQIASELTAMNATSQDWNYVESLLDEAMEALDEPDRAAVLLRYFENKSLREVGQLLGATDNAAQKRIARAVERLREFFAKQGVTIGATSLATALSTNAVQAAPIGLSATISTAAFLSGTTLAGHTAGAIAMTTLQKTFAAAAFATAVGTGIFQAHKASNLQTQIQSLQKQQTPLAEQIQQLQTERDDSSRQIAALRADNDRINQDAAELLKLRGEIALLRLDPATRAQPSVATPQPTQINEPSLVSIGRELGTAVVQGQPGAFAKLAELSTAQHASFKTNNVGLNDTQRSDLSRQTFAPVNAAFKVIQEAAVNGNQTALQAIVQSLQIPELKGGAIQSLGAVAGTGHEAALEILINPRKYGIVPSTVVGALQPAADSGNQKAIDSLASVASDPKQHALWYLTAKGLTKSATAGNPIAIDALIRMSVSTNINIRNAVMPGLRAASSHDARAADALRSVSAQK